MFADAASRAMTAAVTRMVVVLGHRPDTCAELAQELAELALVHAAQSPEDVLELLDRRPILAVVSELDLGSGLSRDGRGLELLRAVSMRAPGCARILLTAQRLAVLDDRACRAIDAVFNVPWPRGAIVDHLRAYGATR
jgi:DNA-binding NtrC family response regulator